jgi:hypothetical protein
MTKRPFFIGGLVCLSAFALAQTLPPTTHPTPQKWIAGDLSKWEREQRTFRLEGKDYLTLLYLEETALGPEWESPSPLPIGLDKAEEIARSELRKLVADEPHWMVTDFHVGRFQRRANWYYAVTLKPDVEVQGVKPDSFVALVDFSGKPGRIAQIESNKPH